MRERGSKKTMTQKAWDVELEALKNIQEGKTEMEIVDADKLIKELEELENI